MDNEEPGRMMRLLGAVAVTLILVALIEGRAAASALTNGIAWIVLAVVIVTVVAFAIKSAVSAGGQISDEIRHEKVDRLYREVSTLSGQRLVMGVPRIFDSEEAARAFGERWTRGGPDSFSVQGGPGPAMLDVTPAFFGVSKATMDSPTWHRDYERAQNGGLKSIGII